ncbi:type II toxin-antitoxin system RelE/ParE family toxin [Histophilus somni]|nr:type II toxin-antitoxin system RelE/ParE family toxin [Histophilus somni]QEH13878.1 type II toxin-antitoxin system RelE/ParE family toxin [Histophilus somni]QEH15675.1 type II toxin-antitoxin system RelE/ParE family toxin [Histophilus somni]QEH22877.1 type II toxin-antitoxin system RelE/ParE family toxin [Histophilus somni]TFI33573.1 type II toxin-antitoxin system RelE/ParE family toxin [Histophilus somni]
MMYTLRYSDKALKQLCKLDKGTQKLILTWIANNLENCENPRIKGKGLTGNRSGEWRYRVGDYRIICDIRDSELIILALSIGHRKNIY